MQAEPVAIREIWAENLLTASAIVNAPTVADVEPAFRAIVPDPFRDKPRKTGREIGVELTGVDVSGDFFDDGRAAARGVTGRPIGVLGREAI